MVAESQWQVLRFLWQVPYAFPLMQIPESVKPPALAPGATVRIVAPASPVQEAGLRRGCEELARLGYKPCWEPRALEREGYFAGPAAVRLAQRTEALADPGAQAVFAARGGYGAGYLLEGLDAHPPARPKIVLGYSDVTLLQALLWQKLAWVTFYGPMVAAGFEAGEDAPGGYDGESFRRAVGETQSGWSLRLRGEALAAGAAEGLLLGGCLTLVESLLGTPWEMETRGAILLLEDRGMRPYQVDRALMHLKLAGKLEEVRGIVLGDFPECDPAEAGSSTVREVCARILLPLGVPVVYGASFGHTKRPMLTLPLGVRARLDAAANHMHILEPAVTG